MRQRPHRLIDLIACALAGLGAASACATLAHAQQPPPATAPGWSIDLNAVAPPVASPQSGDAMAAPGAHSTTVVKQKPKDAAPVADGSSQVRLVALLTADGQRIDNDLVWRIYEETQKPGSAGKLVATHREASPVLRLAPGSYIVNAAFGRAHITRKITVGSGVETSEPFVLNAGGLRVQVAADPAAKLDVSKAVYDVQTDERDQSGNRALVLSKVKPGIVLRLNSGIYHVVSTYGDANAVVESDVTVEAGKLTEMTITHKPARVTLKLVQRQGGEALPDTEWTLLTQDGRTVKESVGALPTHFVAAGSYMAVAKSQGSVFKREFAVKENEVAQIELLRD